MRDIHVLILPSWYPTRRSPVRGIFFKEQAEALVEHGMKVGIIYIDTRSLRELSPRALKENHYQAAREVENGVIVYRQSAWNFPVTRVKGIYHSFFTHALYSKYVQQNGLPDVIHVHGALWAGYSALSLKRRYQIPYFITEHSSAYFRRRLSGYELEIVREVFRNADSSFAVSRSLSAQLQTILGIKGIDVVPNMVDTEFFSCKERTRRAGDPFVFLSVAFLTPNKRIDVLLKAFSAAFKGNTEVQLEIGGDGEQRDALELLSRELGISDQVTFLGKLGRAEVRDAMCRSNVFVLPSHYETFGVVLIEAMSTGLPIIATRSGGPEDIVTPAVGLLVTPGDVGELAKALITMKNNYNTKYLTNDKKIREYVMRRFSRKAVVELLMRYYKNVKRLSP